jgi:hypothetical protein
MGLGPIACLGAGDSGVASTTTTVNLGPLKLGRELRESALVNHRRRTD